MIDCELYMDRILRQLRKVFGIRLVYVGLQGSYLRGEATQNSDIDIMVVIDNMTVDDLKSYRHIIQDIGDYDKSCGFICSKTDLENWNPLEICNLLHNTKDFHGRLKELVPDYTQEDVRCFAKLSLNNLYHEICHRYIHATEDKNASQLPQSYKSVFFILQTVHYLRTGAFVETKQNLLGKVSGLDKSVLELSVYYPDDTSFDYAFETLFLWCHKTLASV